MEVKRAYKPGEFLAISDLRYEVNVSELGKDFMLDSLRKETIWNAKDKEAIHLYVEHDKSIIGALRCRLKKFDLAVEKKFKIKAPFFDAQLSIVDQLVVKSDFRKSRAAYLLAKEIYAFAIRTGVHVCLIEAENHLVNFYTKIGFKKYREVEYSYGIRNQMMLNLLDFEYLLSIKSPFVQELKIHNQHVYEMITSPCLNLNCKKSSCKKKVCQ